MASKRPQQIDTANAQEQTVPLVTPIVARSQLQSQSQSQRKKAKSEEEKRKWEPGMKVWVNVMGLEDWQPGKVVRCMSHVNIEGKDYEYAISVLVWDKDSHDWVVRLTWHKNPVEIPRCRNTGGTSGYYERPDRWIQ